MYSFLEGHIYAAVLYGEWRSLDLAIWNVDIT